MGKIRLGPIEWGVVTAHYRWGLGVRLEESGDEGIVDRAQIHMLRSTSMRSTGRILGNASRCDG